MIHQQKLRLSNATCWVITFGGQRVLSNV